MASQHLKDHRRSMHYLAFLMGSYLYLVAPYTGCAAYRFLTQQYICINMSVQWYLDWSPYFVVAVNPLVVLIVQKEFRNALKKMFLDKKSRK